MASRGAPCHWVAVAVLPCPPFRDVTFAHPSQPARPGRVQRPALRTQLARGRPQDAGTPASRPPTVLCPPPLPGLTPGLVASRPTTPFSTRTPTRPASSATSPYSPSAPRRAAQPTPGRSPRRRCRPASRPTRTARATTSSTRSSPSSAQTPSSATSRSRASPTASSSTASGSSATACRGSSPKPPPAMPRRTS